MEADSVLTGVNGPVLVRATLTQLSTLESLDALWNPQSYRIRRTNRFAAARAPGVGLGRLQAAQGGEERFEVRLFLDTSSIEGSGRDLRPWVRRLEGWCEPEEATSLPPPILFHWGSFRFRGHLEELAEEWLLFDPDGTPTRAWIDIVLRK